MSVRVKKSKVETKPAAKRREPQDPPNGRPRGLEYKQSHIDSFFTRLSEIANITQACKDTGVDRCWVYHMRHKDPEFEKRILAAIDIGIDALEDKAKERAFEGTEVHRYNRDGDLVETRREFSDTLAVLLLKGHRPEKYKDRVANDNTNLNMNVPTDDNELRERLVAKLFG